MTETRVTSQAVQRRFGEVRRTVMQQGKVTVTHHGKEDMVIVSAEHYADLERYRPVAMYAHEMPPDLISALKAPLPATEAARFDDEADDPD